MSKNNILSVISMTNVFEVQCVLDETDVPCERSSSYVQYKVRNFIKKSSMKMC